MSGHGFLMLRDVSGLKIFCNNMSAVGVTISSEYRWNNSSIILCKMKHVYVRSATMSKPHVVCIKATEGICVCWLFIFLKYQMLTFLLADNRCEGFFPCQSFSQPLSHYAIRTQETVKDGKSVRSWDYIEMQGILVCRSYSRFSLLFLAYNSSIETRPLLLMILCQLLEVVSPKVWPQCSCGRSFRPPSYFALQPRQLKPCISWNDIWCTSAHKYSLEVDLAP